MLAEALSQSAVALHDGLLKTPMWIDFDLFLFPQKSLSTFYPKGMLSATSLSKRLHAQSEPTQYRYRNRRGAERVVRSNHQRYLSRVVGKTSKRDYFFFNSTPNRSTAPTLGSR